MPWGIKNPDLKNDPRYLEGRLSSIDADLVTKAPKKKTDVWIDLVQDFNAKGDGVTDDTAALDNAIRAIEVAGGGTLFIPRTPKPYLIKGSVDLCSNLNIVSNGATFTIKVSGAYQNIFISRSRGALGYGSGACNVLIQGLIFDGDYARNRGVGHTLHHAFNITVRDCIFTEAVADNHNFDLAGCSDILIDNCTFFGFYKQGDREYVESIQIDHSSYLSQPSVADTDVYDGLPTKNVTVQNCQFLPMMWNGVKYPCPNPMGNHSRLEGTIYTNIKFINNLVEDGRTTSDSTAHSKGILHFYQVEGLVIEGNRFILTSNVPDVTIAINIMAYGTAHLMANINNSGSTTVNYNPICCKNVKIVNNTFKNFSNPTTSAVINLEGVVSAIDSSSVYAEDILIEGNSFIDCYKLSDATAAGTQGIASDVISAELTKDLRIVHNYFNNVRRIAYVITSYGVKITNNNCIKAYWHPLNMNNVNDVTIANNEIRESSGGFYVRDAFQVNIKDNICTDDYGGLSFSANYIAIRNIDTFNVSGNYLIGKSGSTFTAISCYVGSKNGIIENNFIVNHLPVVLTTDCINVKFDEKKGLTWVSVGDSITDGGSTYGYYQDSALPLIKNVATHYKRGYSGYSYTRYSSGAYTTILDVTSEIEVADVYTVFLGTNDWSRNAPIGSTADAIGKVDSMWGAMRQLLVDITSKNMYAIVIFITPLKRTNSPAWDVTNGLGLKFSDYVQAIKDFASQYSLPVIDLFNESGISNRTASTYLYDGLHPNLEGNKRIGRLIGKRLGIYV